MIYYHLLLIISWIIYGLIDYRFLGLLVLTSFITYVAGKKKTNGDNKKRSTVISIIILIFILGFFKYLNFFVDTITHIIGVNSKYTIILPVGISFYIFRAISYIVDTYKNPDDDIYHNSFMEVSLYISFFPHLLAGPICRAKSFIVQIRQNKKTNFVKINNGLWQVLRGAFKKLVLANHISVFVDAIYADALKYNSITVFICVIAYSLQIYFDFSGYSDMAIGIGRCLGFECGQNFNYPYTSQNVKEFWKKWHISLSSWLQDYIYIPLGGNRKSKTRTYINLMLTMVLGGLWHGANWTFVIWGALHGFSLIIYRIYNSFVQKEHFSIKYSVRTLFNKVLNFIYISMVWILFRASDLTEVHDIVKGLFNGINGKLWISTWAIIGLLYLVFETKKDKLIRSLNSRWGMFDLSKFVGLVIFFIEIGLIIMFAYISLNPFIYASF